MTDPREELRDLIAARVRSEYDKLPPSRYPTEHAVADAVMGLFHAVRWEDWRIGDLTIHAAGLVVWTKPSAHNPTASPVRSAKQQLKTGSEETT